MNMTDVDVEVNVVAPAVELHTRPFYWSVRRELWENRSIYLAPLIVTAIVLFATLLGTFGLPKKMRNLSNVDPAKQHSAIVRPFSMAPAPIMLTAFLVGIFYSIDALYGERRDRSILFWKSLPVSDRTTVLSKASIPILVLPAIALVLSVATFAILLFASTFVLLVTGTGAGRLWSELRFFEAPIVMAYGLIVHSLWFAPIYSWLILISAWVRRVPLLWAVLPPFTIMIVERMGGGDSFAKFIGYRVTGAMKEAFTMRNGHLVEGLSSLTPWKFATSAGLWLGLIFAAACLAASVRLRRNREPI